MAIETTAGFKPFTQEPIDDRMIANNYDALLAIPSNRRYPGMRVYVLDMPTGTNRKFYELKGSVNVNPIHNDNWEAVTGAVVNAVIDCGNWDPNTGAFPNTGGTGTGGAIKQGNLFYVSVAGTHLGIDYNIGDSIRARVDDATNDNSDWRALEGNVGFVPENSSRKRTTLASPNDTEYPTTKAVNDALAVKEPITIGKTIGSANYTLAVNDANAVVILNGTEAQNITLPTDAIAAIPTNSKVRFAGNSNFAKTFVQGAGATVISPRGLLMDGFKGFVVAEKIAANTWFLSGDLIEPVTPITTTGTVTINTQVCNRLILDMEGKEWKKFKYVGDDTWLGLDVINRVEGSQFVLDIERATSSNMSIRFVQYTELYADVQVIDGGQLVVKGKSTGRTLAKLGCHISSYSAGTNTGLVNTLTYLERTNINS